MISSHTTIVHSSQSISQGESEEGRVDAGRRSPSSGSRSSGSEAFSHQHLESETKLDETANPKFVPDGTEETASLALLTANTTCTFLLQVAPVVKKCLSLRMYEGIRSLLRVMHSDVDALIATFASCRSSGSVMEKNCLFSIHPFLALFSARQSTPTRHSRLFLV